MWHILVENLITDITCVKSTNGNSIDVLLTNRSKCFHHTATFEIGLSDCQKLILTFFKAYFKKPLKNIEYSNYKNFNENDLLTNLTKNLTKGLSIRKNINNMMLNIFWMVLDKHAPMKKKIVRGNEEHFMTKELIKAIMNRHRHKNRYTKWRSRKSFLTFKRQKNIFKNHNKKTKKIYFSKITSNGVMWNKRFWNTVIHFLISKGFLHNEDIALHISDKAATDCNKLAKEFNEY